MHLGSSPCALAKRKGAESCAQVAKLPSYQPGADKKHLHDVGVQSCQDLPHWHGAADATLEAGYAFIISHCFAASLIALCVMA